MSATVQSQAVQYANGVITIIQALASLQTQLTQLNNQNTQLNLANVLSAFATCIVNTDGSLGAADGTPSSAAGHVMDPRVPAQAGLTRAVSAFSIGSALSILQQLNNLLLGNAVSTEAQGPNIIAQFVGG